MAILIPDNIRSNKAIPAPHRRVATALAVGLENEATVWYEPPFDVTGERPHFVVLDPGRGVVVVQVIEQFEDKPEEVLGVWRSRLRVRRAAQELEIPDPLAAAARFADAVAERLRAVPATAHIPVAAMAALPYLTRAQAEDRGLGSVLDLDATLPKETIAAVNAADETLLPRVLARLLGGMLDDDMDDETQRLVRAVIHPDLLIGAPPRTAAPGGAAASGGASEATLLDVDALDEVDIVRVMDREQERLAKGLGSGHRVIRGVAGSGKTLILLHRARMLATLLPGKPILVTCYTKSLAGYLRAQLADLPNVEVRNLDSLMHRVAKDAGTLPPGRIDWERLPSRALEGLRSRNGTTYRAVMVDEAQDFGTEALQFCVELLDAEGEGQEGDLVIVADSAQNIFRRNFRWKDAGINAQGRTRILRVNYRNTRQILGFAYRFLTSGVTDPIVDVDFDDETAIIPAESTERDGPEPSVVVAAGRREEGDAVVARVEAWYRPGLRPRSIAVLMPSVRDAEPLVATLRSKGMDVFWTHGEEGDKDRVGAADETVVVSTIHSSKGLEFPHVVVAGLDRGIYDDDPTKLLYVAFTRAIDELAIVAPQGNSLTKDLLAAASTPV